MSQHRGVQMSFDESFKVDICHQVLRGDIGVKEAALRIGKSYRQTLRIIAKIQAKGLLGVKHGNFGKIPVNKSDPILKAKVLDLYTYIPLVAA